MSKDTSLRDSSNWIVNGVKDSRIERVKRGEIESPRACEVLIGKGFDKAFQDLCRNKFSKFWALSIRTKDKQIGDFFDEKKSPNVSLTSSLSWNNVQINLVFGSSIIEIATGKG